MLEGGGVPSLSASLYQADCPQDLLLSTLSSQVTPSVFVAEIVKEVEVPQAALGTVAHGTGDSCHSPAAEEEVGIPIPAPGLQPEDSG